VGNKIIRDLWDLESFNQNLFKGKKNNNLILGKIIFIII
jgi:hypothetical protein